MYSSPCQRTAWLSMVHKNSPIPCVGKPFSFARNRSSLLQNTETIWWHVLKENIMPLPNKTPPFSSWKTDQCNRLVYHEVPAAVHSCCEEGWVLAPCLCLPAVSQAVVSLAIFFGHWLIPKAGGRQRTLRGSLCVSLFPFCGWEVLKPEPPGVCAGVCTLSLESRYIWAQEGPSVHTPKFSWTHLTQ